jgi:cyclophilin family peptidyl-prolyl cis-trans isomerase
MNLARRIAIATLAAALPLAALAQTQPSSCTAKGNSPMKVKLTTSMGPIVIELDRAKAPVSTDNFVKYVESGHYNGTIFHRVIDGFMIQGGGFTKDMRQKPTQPPIKNEATNGLKNDTYTIAMARTNVPDSATSQFFINVKNNDALNASPGNAGYAVFGKVVEGKETVDKIRKVATGNAGGHQNVPTEAVVIEKAECV